MQARQRPVPQHKPYRIVVWGATGFTGRLVCEHIAREYPGHFSWAIAGRDRGKLERLQRDISQFNLEQKDVPLIVADASNMNSLRQMAACAQVILSTVGPYNKHDGGNVLAACVDEGTQYCDITGELSFVRRMQHQYDTDAKQRRVKVVHCCGFDSVPSDIGTLFMVDYCRTKLGRDCAEVRAYVSGLSGCGIGSGGSLETLFWTANEAGMEMVEMFRDKYYLVRDRSRSGSG